MTATTSTTKDAAVVVVVVGLGMVALRFVEKMLEHAAEGSDAAVKFKLVAFGEEPMPAYNRGDSSFLQHVMLTFSLPVKKTVGLTQYFTHRSVDRLLLQPESWYADNNIQLHLGDKVTRIDTASQHVHSEQGVSIKYDYLVIATGSAAFVPPIPGRELKGVFVYRTIEDVKSIEEYALMRVAAAGKGSAVVIGGGLLGLEAAKVATDLGLTTSVIERNPYLMSRQLNQEAAHLLHTELDKLNLTSHCSIGIRQLAPHQDDPERVGCVEMEPLKAKAKADGSPPTPPPEEAEERRSVEVDVVIIATGIKARDEVAREAGIECHERGGVVVDGRMCAKAPNVYAIGEVASFEGNTFGLVAPGYEMAEIAANQIVQRMLASTSGIESAVKLAEFTFPDLSTKLKLMGVHVASFGDYFAKDKEHVPLTYRDPFAYRNAGGVYKRLLFTKDGKRLLGGILVGDTTDYTRLLAISKSKTALKHGTTPADILNPPTKKASGASEGNDLPLEAQVCSCNNVTKAHLVDAVKKKGCSSVGEVRSCTKAGTGCGGCVPLVTEIVIEELGKLGKKVLNHVCEHFAYSRRELFDIVKVTRAKSFEAVLKSHGKGFGCEVCKPTVGSILASLWNEPVLETKNASLQDTNDKFLANIQRGGTYSVVPRVPGGEITPEKLIVLGQVAKKYGLYTKITGGQRIDLFGAQRHDLPEIWEELVAAGFESGHAYGKALRTVKSCVGSTWCRYGRRDSVGFAIALEQRYKGIRAAHKIKGGVSGCIRECAEAQSKDFGLIATEKGYNLYVCGNGGSKPVHAVLLAADVSETLVIRYLDRFLMYYIATADRLQRTARWLEKLQPEGGIEHVKAVVIEDKLGIAGELERQMEALVNSYFCEWKDVVVNPERRKLFRQFVNDEAPQDTIEFITERGQRRPADWDPDVPASTVEAAAAAAEAESAKLPELPKSSMPDGMAITAWKGEMRWLKIGHVSDFPVDGGATVKIGETQIAVFNFTAMGKWYATQNMCPHKRAFVLSSGILGDAGTDAKVSCPNHKKNFSLSTGACLSDAGTSAIATFAVQVDPASGTVSIHVPPTPELDDVLGTSKHMVKASRNMKANGRLRVVDAEVLGDGQERYAHLWSGERPRHVELEIEGPVTILKEGVGCGSGGCGDSKLDW
ncbi:hypothetical protein HDU96_010809 [Phlyctochytrium bullatum]|nr:hypothetical protein HDU96_010809 [Phlyctochytrium bullatum]